jgi:molecular chaperone DnaJ
LILQVPITYPQAVLGDEILITCLDKKQVKLKIPSGTQSGKFFRLKDRGIKNLNGYGCGDLLIEIVVVVPTKLSGEEKELILKLNDLYLGKEIEMPNQHKSIVDKIKEIFK